jgi:polysaccharide export outer membrane protein
MNRKAFYLLFCSLFFLVSCGTAPKRALCTVAPCLQRQAGFVPLKAAVQKSSDGVESEGEGDVFSDYLIGPEDVIEVSVWKSEALSKVVTVRPDGKISLPLIGDIDAAGRTAGQLKEIIRQKLEDYKQTPEVSIILQQVNSYIVYVLGEVAKPGKYPLKSQTTLLQGITLAGGFTQYASRNSIILLRRNGFGEVRVKIKYDDLISGKRGSENPLLLPGDTVVVP